MILDLLNHVTDDGERFPGYIQHIPHIAEYLMSSTLMARATKHLTDFAYKRTMMRIEKGPEQRDLMSYFVRPPTISCHVSAPNSIYLALAP